MHLHVTLVFCRLPHLFAKHILSILHYNADISSILLDESPVVVKIYYCPLWQEIEMAKTKKGVGKLRKLIRSELDKKNTHVIRIAPLTQDFHALLQAASEELKTEKDPVKAAVLNNLAAEIHFLTSNAGKAAKITEKISHNTTLPPPVRANALAITAQVHIDRGEYPRGEELCKEALALIEKDEDVLLSKVLNVIGSLHYIQGRYSLALEYSRLRKTVAESSGTPT